MTKRHRLIVIGVVLAISAVVAAPLFLKSPPLYRVTVLPSINGAFMRATAINDRGQVVGFSQRSGDSRLFLWDREHGMRDLGLTGRGTMDINNRGQISGSVQDANGVEQAFFWDPNSGVCLLGTLGGSSSWANAINDRGWIVGGYQLDKNNQRAFLWDQTHGMRNLGPAGGTFRLAWTLNDANQAVVFDAGGTFIVRMDEQGVVQTCDRLPIQGLPRMNNSGRVVGVTRVTQDESVAACWDPNAGLQTLSREAFDTGAAAINDAGQVIFSQERDAPVQVLGKTLLASQAEWFLRDPKRGEIPLNRYVSVKKGETLWLTDINNQGCILGVVHSDKGGTSRAVLLEPIPERWNK